ncbi:MAG: hypothetical protein IKB04_02690 [Clostridia bacterium]|nr:hypothetical protein [Clostridia bacterium]
MRHEWYDRCANSVSEALSVLDFLRHREAITAATVEALHRRRHTADIALKAAFEELRRAFITPADREDLWLLWQTAEQITEAAEEIVLSLIRKQHSCLTPNDTAQLAAVTAECRALHEAFAALPDYPHSDRVLQHVDTAERLHRQTEKITGHPLTDAALRHVSATCATATRTIRYALLKMT